MARPGTPKRQKSSKTETRYPDPLRTREQGNPFRRREEGEPTREAEARVHLLGPGIVCDTEPRGHATPRGRSPLEIVVDASEGFIPLWAAGTSLRWRFREQSVNDYFANPEAAKTEIQDLFGEALLAWGAAAPVTFTKDEDVWDFEIVMRSGDDCDANGCVLADRPFFPDSGRHRFVMYPKMFTQTRKEQVDTFIHEVGHIFGLRHFFANVSETAWPSEIFGTHSKFSIMNYGALSALTDNDRTDLASLYQLAWSGELTQINGTPIRLVEPYHALAPAPGGMVAVRQVPSLQPLPRAAYISLK